ncbi:hypothetical protein AVEN_225252-1 [Araneus ventricosus]|uniref:Uncharacterized protein n=1 Tax=Araneus ventricosus TaxID=182803 RepID=A0A4Y2AMR4_ARAVE|nr:hypothetical protein AVEN_225252-1 [Araneus ventricosus]
MSGCTNNLSKDSGPSIWPRWPSGKVSVSGRRVQCSKPDSTEDLPSVWAWCTLNLMSWVKHPPEGAVQKFGERFPTQVLASSSDRGSKLSVRSQNSLVLLLNGKLI